MDQFKILKNFTNMWKNKINTDEKNEILEECNMFDDWTKKKEKFLKTNSKKLYLNIFFYKV